jgi:adenylate cyclase
MCSSLAIGAAMLRIGSERNSGVMRVNRYTESVSQIVQRHSGSVVEFNGDGMMAVFGAPKELARKERAAVEAGSEILEVLAALPVSDSDRDFRFKVGIGVATGEAFVGNIRSADRYIWSAIGNTTNLAARLEALTRSHETQMIIDANTWTALAHERELFIERGDQMIQGRSEPIDIFLLAAGD